MDMAKPARVDRRRFLSLAAWCGGAGLFWGSSLADAGEPTIPAILTKVLERATVQHFARFVGHDFLVHPAAGPPLMLTLASAENLHPVNRGYRRPFSLLFHSPTGRSLTQDTYRIAHPVLGNFALFLVPIGPPHGPAVLQAVFA